MQFLKKFCMGAVQPLRGICFFYQQPALWKYSLGPLFFVLIFYAFIFWGGMALNTVIDNSIRQWVGQWPQQLHFLGSIFAQAVRLTIILIIITLMALAAGSVYELFGGVFFDRLITQLHSGQLNCRLPEASFKFDLLALKDSVIYSTVTFIWIIGILLLSFALPLIGQLISTIVIGYRLGVTYLATVGFRHHINMDTLRFRARQHLPAVLGFGVITYILFTIPLACILLMPGIITGSVLLFHKLRLYGKTTN